jgi:hypothetical protein
MKKEIDKMKRTIAIVLSSLLTIGLIGCGKAAETPGDVTVTETVDVTDAADLLTQVWNSYDDADKFAIGGGDYNNMVMDAPGKFDVSMVEDLDAMLGLPQSSASMIDDAASVMHMMNANTFTAGAYHVSDAANQQTVVDSLKENIMNRQWMCGFPDTLIVAKVGGEYVVSAFGNAEIIENFKNKLSETFTVTDIVYEESLTE